ncbi:MAG: hypothetical protein KDD94_02980 [Calditrichaeota bacterium]|nr:hypothetical protein [Calditrichota bacterium]
MKRSVHLALSVFLCSIIAAQSGAGAGTGQMMSSKSLEDREMDIGLTAAYWLEGDADIDGFTATKDGSFMFRGFIDGYLMPKFAMGAYINVTPYSQEGIDFTGLEFGMAIKPRFILSNGKAAIKPGLNIGYRSISSDFFDTVSGLGVNLSIEYQIMTDANIFHIEGGFLSQPAGGNDDSDVTWAPVFYVGGGITL